MFLHEVLQSKFCINIARCGSQCAVLQDALLQERLKQYNFKKKRMIRYSMKFKNRKLKAAIVIVIVRIILFLFVEALSI